MFTQEQKDFMQTALHEAHIAWQTKDEVPIGAVVVCQGRVIARAHNTKESTNLSTGHAEIRAIEKASSALGRWRLDDCQMYVTLEPCAMCAGALIQARIKTLYFGAFDQKAGACGSLFQLNNDARLNHRFATYGGLLEDQCAKILKDFFFLKRKKSSLIQPTT